MNDFGQGFGGSSGTEDLVYQWRAASGYRAEGDGPWTGSYDEPIVEVGARYYMPAMGVFITRDKDLSQRPYEYCNADPVNYTDSSGYSPKTTKSEWINPDGTRTEETTTINDDGSWTTTDITYNVDNTPISVEEWSSDGSWTKSDWNDIFNTMSTIGSWETGGGGAGSTISSALYQGLTISPSDTITLMDAFTTVPGVRYIVWGVGIGGFVARIIGGIGSALTR